MVLFITCHEKSHLYDDEEVQKKERTVMIHESSVRHAAHLEPKPTLVASTGSHTETTAGTAQDLRAAQAKEATTSDWWAVPGSTGLGPRPLL